MTKNARCAYNPTIVNLASRMSRFLAHVLLSLLLLASQQLLLQHGFTHWDAFRKELVRQGALEPGQDGSGKPAKPVFHELCAECQADPQLAFALPSAAYRFTLLDLDAGPLAARCAEGIRLPPPRLFQSRAPPSLS